MIYHRRLAIFRPRGVSTIFLARRDPMFILRDTISSKRMMLAPCRFQMISIYLIKPASCFSSLKKMMVILKSRKTIQRYNKPQRPQPRPQRIRRRRCADESGGSLASNNPTWRSHVVILLSPVVEPKPKWFCYMLLYNIYMIYHFTPILPHELPLEN